MKIVYHFDENGAYCGASEAYRSPLEDGVYLIPAMATEVMPPVSGTNEWPVWESGKWTLKPDFREKVYWLDDGTECKIDRIGETFPAGALLERPIAIEEERKAGSWLSRFFR